MHQWFSNQNINEHTRCRNTRDAGDYIK